LCGRWKYRIGGDVPIGLILLRVGSGEEYQEEDEAIESKILLYGISPRSTSPVSFEVTRGLTKQKK
jgi:hypothetical protein